jgi:DNA-3-methyladenine glycosylase
MNQELRHLLAGAPEDAAPQLLGSLLVSDLGGERVVVALTEVEAYKGSEDSASHAYRGPTERNRAMFEKPGTLYVYRSYGIHWCANSSAGPPGVGWGILMRGAEIVEGGTIAARRRGRSDELVNGPGKLTQALGINGDHNGADLLDPASPIRLHSGQRPELVMATPRVGISKATDLAWRFVAAVSAGS